MLYHIILYSIIITTATSSNNAFFLTVNNVDTKLEYLQANTPNIITNPDTSCYIDLKLLCKC